ncbi:MAG: hypothetical protein ABSG27_03255 [Candidatus Acidiferrales bacterium]|jgi:Tfp pilus assembly protein PilN
MGMLEILFIVWGVITVVLVCAMIYRSTLASREEDQIFLDSAGDSMAQEQREIVARLEKLGPPITVLMVISGVLLVAIFGMWLYQGFRNF